MPTPLLRLYFLLGAAFFTLLPTTQLADARSSKLTTELNFFGAPVWLPYPSELVHVADGAAPARPSIGERMAYWTTLHQRLQAMDNTDALSHPFALAADSLKLDGLGMAMLTDTFCRKVLPHDAFARTAVQHYLLHTLGYDVLILWNEKQAGVFGKANANVFQVPVLKRGNALFESLTNREQPMAMRGQYEWALPAGKAAGKGFAPLLLPRLPEPEGVLRVFRFSFNGQALAVRTTTTPNLHRYLLQTPQMEPNALFLRPEMEGRASHEVAENLRNLADSLMLDTPATLNLMLAFVQSLPYRRDEVALGRERSFYPDQTLTAPYSDCEDRTLLYAYLCKEVLGIRSVALFYPDHANVALAFAGGNIEAVSVWFKGSRYLVCEPTGVGAIGHPFLVERPKRMQALFENE